MRLTLRNLLAYLHGTLTPEHQVAFAALVQNTPRVQLLVDRCKHIGQRGLAAPAVDQASSQHQAEAVAKYLDFTLSDADLAAFEKAALGSDEQLAEIVACHQVLSDVLLQRPSTPLPNCRARLVALAGNESATSTTTGQQVAVGRHQLVGAAAVASTSQADGFSPVSAVVKAELHDSGDLTNYLSDVDDEEELSIDAAQDRERLAEQRAVAAAASAYATGGGGTSTATSNATRYTTYGARDPFKTETKVAAALLEKTPNPVPLVAGIGGGAALLLGLMVWLGSMLFAGKPDGQPVGPHIYGIEASAGVTCELHGTVLYQPSGAAPSPDVGAIVLAWPTNPTGNVNRLTTSALLASLEQKQQSPYNIHLIAAKVDDDGHFQMRMHEYGEFHVMILSHKSTTTNPNTWGEAVVALQPQLEDPPVLIGQSKYEYRKLAMPADRRATVEHTFAD